jgi:hypothetical protein
MNVDLCIFVDRNKRPEFSRVLLIANWVLNPGAQAGIQEDTKKTCWWIALPPGLAPFLWLNPFFFLASFMPRFRPSTIQASSSSLLAIPSHVRSHSRRCPLELCLGLRACSLRRQGGRGQADADVDLRRRRHRLEEPIPVFLRQGLGTYYKGREMERQTRHVIPDCSRNFFSRNFQSNSSQLHCMPNHLSILCLQVRMGRAGCHRLRQGPRPDPQPRYVVGHERLGQPRLYIWG